MHNTVTIDGQEYPISFGTLALGRFCREANLSLKDMQELEKHLDLVNTVILVKHGLRDGHRKAKLPGKFEMSLDDVGDLLDSEPGVLERIMDVFAEAMPEPASEGKPKAQTAEAKD